MGKAACWVEGKEGEAALWDECSVCDPRLHSGSQEPNPSFPACSPRGCGSLAAWVPQRITPISPDGRCWGGSRHPDTRDGMEGARRCCAMGTAVPRRALPLRLGSRCGRRCRRFASFPSRRSGRTGPGRPPQTPGGARTAPRHCHLLAAGGGTRRGERRWRLRARTAALRSGVLLPFESAGGRAASEGRSRPEPSVQQKRPGLWLGERGQRRTATRPSSPSQPLPFMGISV